MLEATLVLFVVVVALLAILLMRVMKPRRDPVKDLARLREHIARLEERQRHAEAQRWDDAMKRGIEQQLAEARRELEQLAA